MSNDGYQFAQAVVEEAVAAFDQSGGVEHDRAAVGTATDRWSRRVHHVAVCQARGVVLGQALEWSVGLAQQGRGVAGVGSVAQQAA